MTTGCQNCSHSAVPGIGFKAKHGCGHGNGMFSASSNSLGAGQAQPKPLVDERASDESKLGFRASFLVSRGPMALPAFIRTGQCTGHPHPAFVPANRARHRMSAWALASHRLASIGRGLRSGLDPRLARDMFVAGVSGLAPCVKCEALSLTKKGGNTRLRRWMGVGDGRRVRWGRIRASDIASCGTRFPRGMPGLGN